LSIDVKTSNGKIAFNIVKGCKSKDYPDGLALYNYIIELLRGNIKSMSLLCNNATGIILALSSSRVRLMSMSIGC
jgi:hypothetical protein